MIMQTIVKIMQKHTQAKKWEKKEVNRNHINRAQ